MAGPKALPPSAREVYRKMLATRALARTAANSRARLAIGRLQLADMRQKGTFISIGIIAGTWRCWRDLRITYGPEYTMTANLNRLRSRGLGRKRSLAQREFALGVEALERFVRNEPLRRVHECVFAVLALHSEAVDPRL